MERKAAKILFAIAALVAATAICVIPRPAPTPRPAEVRFVNDGCLEDGPGGVLVVTRDGRLRLTPSASSKFTTTQLHSQDVDPLFAHLAQWAAERHPPPTAADRAVESVGWCTFDVAGKRFERGLARLEGAFALARDDAARLWRLASRP
jgi:hypothetical protein